MIRLPECLKGSEVFVAGEGASLLPLSSFLQKGKQSNDDEMTGAMSAVRNGTTIRWAEEEHGVPPSTLRDRIRGRVVHGTKPGPKPYLSLDDLA